MIKKYCDRCGKDATVPDKVFNDFFYKITEFSIYIDDHKKPKEIHLCPKCASSLKLWLDKED